MNIEICRYCASKKDGSHIIDYLCVEKNKCNSVIYIGCREFVNVNTKKEFSYCHLFCIKKVLNDHNLPDGKNKVFSIENVQLQNQDCPYFFEHQMYDWSKRP